MYVCLTGFRLLLLGVKTTGAVDTRAAHVNDHRNAHVEHDSCAFTEPDIGLRQEYDGGGWGGGGDSG